MNFEELLTNHKKAYKQRLTDALAKKNSMTSEEAAIDFKDFIAQYVTDKYSVVTRVVKEINGIEIPVLLNIRRDRMREDKCRICESNEPNISAIGRKYGNRVKIFEVAEDKPEGALYQIIYYEEAKDKKLPLTAIINRGEIIKYWAGKTVDAIVYERYLNRILT